MNLINSNIRVDQKNNQIAPAPSVTVDHLSLFRQLSRVAWRWRYVIGGITIACALLGLITTLMLTKKFTATTIIEIARDSNKVTNFEGVQQEVSVGDQEFYQTQYGLLRSNSLAERVATQLHLADDPGFFEKFGKSSSEDALQLVNGRYIASMRPARIRMAGDILLRNLDVSPTRLSRLVNVSFTGPDPKLSATVANTWAENFIQTNLERKIQATSYGRDMLQRQLAQLKARLDESQRQLVAYASKEQIINLPSIASGDGKTTSERSIVADDLAALNTALAEATSDRIRAEARLPQSGRANTSSEALINPAINVLRQRRAELAAEYQKLMIQFEPGYPTSLSIHSQIEQLDRSIAQEESRVSNTIRSQYREARNRETALENKVDALKQSYLDLRRRSIQYNIYQQEVDTNRALYDGLLQRFKEIGVAGGVGVNNVSVVDAASIPEKASSPRLMINLVLSLLVGLGLGALAAYILEQIDEAIVDPSEVERRLGLPLLGSVPKLQQGTPKEALLDRKSELFDAYLAVQTNLAFTTEHGVPRSFAITSTRPAEGKSTTALALATTLARAQRKVILVDGDMRSPSVHHLGGVGHEHGLSTFLSGQDAIDTLTFPMTELGFTAMSAGPIPPNAAELLTGHRLALLIKRLLDSYDHVIIDSPPVMGLADAPLIASRVEGVVYAVESHGIRSSLVKTALSRLASANARVIGGILTKFEPQRAHYGYGYEYGYSYGRTPETE